MAIRTSQKIGNASDPTVWSGGAVPVEGDSVIIAHTVTYDIANGIWGDDSMTAIQVNSGGTLKASRTGNSQLTVKGQVVINSGGSLDYGLSSDPIPSTYTAKIILNYSAAMATGKYGLTVNNGGNIWSFGANKTRKTVSTALANLGQAVITVADATGWQAGDTIGIGSSNLSGDAETRVILSIAGNNITLTSNLTSAHASGVPIVNVSSNVVFNVYNTSYQSYMKLISTATSGASTREMQHTLFSYLGVNPVGDTSTYGVSFQGSTSYLTQVWKSFANNGFFGGTYGIDFLTFVQPGFTFSGNVFTGLGSSCFYVRAGAVVAVDSCHSIRNPQFLYSAYSQGGAFITVSNCIANGNSSNVFNIAPLMGGVVNDSVFDANANFLTAAQTGTVQFNRCKINMGAGTPTTATIFIGQANTSTNVIMADCQIKAGSYSNMTTSFSLGLPSNKFTWANKNLDPLQQEIYMSTGVLYRDNAFYRTAAPSIRVEPSSSTSPFTFSINVFAPNNKPVVVSGYIQKNSSYGSSNLPTVTLSGLGITPDTFTIADVNDTWQQFKVQGTQTSGTDGMLTVTFSIQSAGAGAKVWVDDVVAPVSTAVNVGEFGYWANGLPVQAVLANFVSANDVWNIQENQLTLTGSIGKFLKDELRNILNEVL